MYAMRFDNHCGSEDFNNQFLHSGLLQVKTKDRLKDLLLFYKRDEDFSMKSITDAKDL